MGNGPPGGFPSEAVQLRVEVERLERHREHLAKLLDAENENNIAMRSEVGRLERYRLAFQWLCDNQCHLSLDSALRPDCWAVVDVDGIVLSRAESSLEAVLVAMRYCEARSGNGASS